MSEQETQVHLPFFGIPKLLPYLKIYRSRMILMALMGVGSSLADSFFPLFNQYAINHFIGLQTTDTMPLFILAYLSVLMIQGIFNYISVYWCGKMEMDMSRDLRNDSFAHLQTLSFSYFSQNNVGYIHARVMSDTGKIGELVSWRFMDIVWQGSYLLFVVVIMLRTNLRLGLMILVLLPIVTMIISFFQRRLIRLNRQVREINSLITSNYNEGITGAKSIKTMVIEELMNENFRKDTGNMLQTSVKTARYSAALSSLVSLVGAIALALVLWQGGRLTQENVMLIGTLSVFMSYALNLAEPIQSIVQTFAAAVAVQVNIERFSHLMETKSDVADRADVIEKYGDTFNPKKENWEAIVGDIEFKDVSFQYPDGNELVLDHFNLKVPHGTNVAIVGETGAGKSTLVNLVCRFYEPTKGQILIDGIDARERSQSWLHAHLGYVLQSPHLFSGTIRDNLRYAKPDASDEEILEALRIVDALSVLDKTDKGLDTEVGEGGDRLSTGEKQLLCFARALLADPRILVLDEATASIDTLTEKVIQDAINTVIQGRTSFVIAHRLSTIVDADIILVVDDGKIIESGKHAELMRKKGHYYKLYTRQYEEMLVQQMAQ